MSDRWTLADVKRAAAALGCEVEAGTTGGWYEVEVVAPDRHCFACGTHVLTGGCYATGPFRHTWKSEAHAGLLNLLKDLGEGLVPCSCGDCE